MSDDSKVSVTLVVASHQVTVEAPTDVDLYLTHADRQLLTPDGRDVLTWTATIPIVDFAEPPEQGDTPEDT